MNTASGNIVRGFKSTYQRQGTLTLFAALQVATGSLHTATTPTKTREDFLAFMDPAVAETPVDKELHVSLDNYCTHQRNDEWLAKHPHVYFHFTPLRQLVESGGNWVRYPESEGFARRQFFQ